MAREFVSDLGRSGMTGLRRALVLETLDDFSLQIPDPRELSFTGGIASTPWQRLPSGLAATHRSLRLHTTRSRDDTSSADCDIGNGALTFSVRSERPANVLLRYRLRPSVRALLRQSRNIEFRANVLRSSDNLRTVRAGGAATAFSQLDLHESAVEIGNAGGRPREAATVSMSRRGFRSPYLHVHIVATGALYYWTCNEFELRMSRGLLF